LFSIASRKQEYYENSVLFSRYGHSLLEEARLEKREL